MDPDDGGRVPQSRSRRHSSRHQSSRPGADPSRTTRTPGSKSTPTVIVEELDLVDLRRARTEYYARPAEERRRSSSSVFQPTLPPRAGDSATGSLGVRSHSTRNKRHEQNHKRRESQAHGRRHFSRDRDGERTSRRHNRSEGKSKSYIAPKDAPSVISLPTRRTPADGHNGIQRKDNNRVVTKNRTQQVDASENAKHHAGRSGTRHRTSSTERSTHGLRKPPSLGRRFILATVGPKSVGRLTLEPTPAQQKRSRGREESLRSPKSISHKVSASIPPVPEEEEIKKVNMLDCLICTDTVESTKAATLACQHSMCHDCLKNAFELSVRESQHMPPKCCTSAHIPVRNVTTLFDDDFKRLWNKKYQEHVTKDRLYCPKCSKWIEPSHISVSKKHGRKYGHCKSCKLEVCASCGAKWHKGSECPKDPAAVSLANLAQEEGWQRCYSCKAMVERRDGCNHMTCRCGAQFCIMCGTAWKSCDCEWFPMTMLNPNAGNNGNPAANWGWIAPELVGNIGAGIAGILEHPGLHNDPIGAAMDVWRRNRVRVADPLAHQAQAAGPAPRHHQRRGYAEEIEARRQQEVTDEAYARRLAEMEFGAEHLNFDDDPRRAINLPVPDFRHLPADHALNFAVDGLVDALRVVRDSQQERRSPPQHERGQRRASGWGFWGMDLSQNRPDRTRNRNREQTQRQNDINMRIEINDENENENIQRPTQQQQPTQIRASMMAGLPGRGAGRVGTWRQHVEYDTTEHVPPAQSDLDELWEETENEHHDDQYHDLDFEDNIDPQNKDNGMKRDENDNYDDNYNDDDNDNNDDDDHENTKNAIRPWYDRRIK